MVSCFIMCAQLCHGFLCFLPVGCGRRAWRYASFSFLSTHVFAWWWRFRTKFGNSRASMKTVMLMQTMTFIFLIWIIFFNLHLVHHFAHDASLLREMKKGSYLWIHEWDNRVPWDYFPWFVCIYVYMFFLGIIYMSAGVHDDAMDIHAHLWAC